ncbi:MAG: bifunctional pyr operon transcriptional regulator/uracil phosphoribosyltransferase PyrR [Arenicellales bacterium]
MTKKLDVEVSALLDKLVTDLTPLLALNPVIIGIHTGGSWLAEILHQRLAMNEPCGSLDISFYRDDFSRIGLNPEVRASDIPQDISDRHILLIDDVLQTGRTVRAAMNEIFDYGRPASIRLCVLVERNGHELPVQADYFGMKLDLRPDQQIKLTGPEKLSLIVGDLAGGGKQS